MLFKTVLTFIHLTSFALSFGLVVFGDFIMMKVPLTGRASGRDIELLRTMSRFIFLALGALVFSGIGFLAYYYFDAPEALSNPKLYAKMVIVTVLAVNGQWLHHRGLKLLSLGAGSSLRDPAHLPLLRKLLISGGISGLSWWSAFILGTFRELNFVVSFRLILLVYLVGVVGVIAGVEGFIHSLRPRPRACRLRVALHRLHLL